MIDEAGREGVSKSSCGLHALVKRQENLVKHAETLEKRISDDSTNLDYTRREITVTQVGIFWAKTKALEELEIFIARSIDGPHSDVLEALQEHNDATGAPMTATDLKDKVLNADLELNSDTSVTVVIQDLIKAGVVIRGGPDHPPGLRGKLWTSVYDLRTEIEDEEKALRSTGNFDMPVIPEKPNNVVALRPNDSP